MSNQFLVAVIGAGPSGLFAARELATHGVRVLLFNRDIKAGGLAEYGIYLDKYTMKSGLRKQFRQALEQPNLEYYGNLLIGAHGDLTLEQLRAFGFDAILVTTGAQGTKWLGLPGEDLEGVYHAKDVVFSYNQLPPFSQKKFRFGKKCAIIGAGNVMVDIARFLIHYQHVDEITAIVRRGPNEVNFTKEEMKHLISYLDLNGFEAEMARVLPVLQALPQDPELGRQKVLEALPKADPKTKPTHFHFDFLASPTAMFGENGKLTQLEVEDNALTLKDGEVKARGTGQKRLLDVETVIFAIGDKVDESFGLPTERNEFIKNPNPKFPEEGVSYETPLEGVFVGGWSRKASEGLVGVARKDGINAAKAVLKYLETRPAQSADVATIRAALSALGKPIITKADLKKLEGIEAEEAKKRGLEDFKFSSNAEMLEALNR
ncbi:MAG: FAD-dependent oxidoreductase [Anaerolineales bacterium]|nr:FAD-dependent oxidoreductase [Anaerolineales bacterium]